MQARVTIVTIAVLSSLTALGLPHAAQAAADHALIAEVYYDTYVSGESDEFVRIHNPTATALDLTGWTIADGEGTLTFPPGARLAPGGSAYVTGRATSFRLDMVASPQWEYLSDTDPAIPELARSGTFALSNAGDEVLLRDATATLVDALIYGASAYAGAGWSGAPVQAVSEGVVLERDSFASGGLADTDAPADWDDARVYYAGQSHISPRSFTFTGNMTTFSSPDSSYATILQALDATTTSIDLGIYEVTNMGLGQKLVERAQAGVTIRILLEGGPAGFAQEERYQENWIVQRLVAAGADVRFIVTNDTLGIHDRYNYIHAKYAILDGSRVLAMSGNWKVTGVPPDPTTGNREWGILVDHAPLAAHMRTVFDDDFDSAHRDILAFGAGSDWRYQPPPAAFVPNATVPNGTYEHPYPARVVNGPSTITPVLAPDTVLLERGGLLDRLRAAQQSILIEQMYAHKHWGSQNDTPTTAPNLLLEAAIDAARQNRASVYVLLGDEYIDEEDTRNNKETRDYLNGLRATEGIPVYARIVDHAIANLTKIHNKGVVIDGEAALVSSINWGRASPTLNREVALLVENADVADFFSDLFWYDWAPRERVAPVDLVVDRLEYAQRELIEGVPDAREGVLRVTVTNVGPLDVHKAFVVSTTGTPTGIGANLTLPNATIAGLAAGTSTTVEVPLDTIGRLGAWTFVARVDDDGRVGEVDEGNNAREATADILVAAPGINARA